MRKNSYPSTIDLLFKDGVTGEQNALVVAMEIPDRMTDHDVQSAMLSVCHDVADKSSQNVLNKTFEATGWRASGTNDQPHPTPFVPSKRYMQGFQVRVPESGCLETILVERHAVWSHIGRDVIMVRREGDIFAEVMQIANVGTAFSARIRTRNGHDSIDVTGASLLSRTEALEDALGLAVAQTFRAREKAGAGQ